MADTRIRPFTTRTRVALAIARGIAAARGDHDLTPKHVAIGILREGGNPAVAALYNRGLAASPLRVLVAELQEGLGLPSGGTGPRQVTIGVTPGEEQVIQRGEIEAARLGDEYLGTEHLLLALLRDSADDVAVLFSKYGISAELVDLGLSAVRRGDMPKKDS